MIFKIRLIILALVVTSCILQLCHGLPYYDNDDDGGGGDNYNDEDEDDHQTGADLTADPGENETYFNDAPMAESPDGEEPGSGESWEDLSDEDEGQFLGQKQLPRQRPPRPPQRPPPNKPRCWPFPWPSWPPRPVPNPTPNPSSPPNPSVNGKLSIDAFNYKVCGQFSNAHLVRGPQNAFRCAGGGASRRRRRGAGDDYDEEEEMGNESIDMMNNDDENFDHINSTERIVDGRAARWGEFPSHVDLIMSSGGRGMTLHCGGTLIHNNLVITAAHCISENYPVITAKVGTLNKQTGTGVRAERWCWHRNYNKAAVSYDLGMIKLSQPVTYVPGKVQPSCMIINRQHQASAQCVVIGMGKYDNTGALSSFLRTIGVTRSCNVWGHNTFGSCYQSQPTGGTCQGDSGSGLYCFDNCGGKSPKTFVVGAVSSGPYGCQPGVPKTMTATDFNKMQNDVRKMIRMLVNNEQGEHICRQGR
uniref:Chymotrypsin-like elastase family member 1 n=1 Tax=Aceria tosichella TaxID=561515 RepID=A0A6G1S4B7_9ACAR